MKLNGMIAASLSSFVALPLLADCTDPVRSHYPVAWMNEEFSGLDTIALRFTLDESVRYASTSDLSGLNESELSLPEESFLEFVGYIQGEEYRSAYSVGGVEGFDDFSSYQQFMERLREVYQGFSEVRVISTICLNDAELLLFSPFELDDSEFDILSAAEFRHDSPDTWSYASQNYLYGHLRFAYTDHYYLEGQTEPPQQPEAREFTVEFANDGEFFGEGISLNFDGEYIGADLPDDSDSLQAISEPMAAFVEAYTFLSEGDIDNYVDYFGTERARQSLREEFSGRSDSYFRISAALDKYVLFEMDPAPYSIIFYMAGISRTRYLEFLEQYDNVSDGTSDAEMVDILFSDPDIGISHDYMLQDESEEWKISFPNSQTFTRTLLGNNEVFGRRFMEAVIPSRLVHDQ